MAALIFQVAVFLFILTILAVAFVPVLRESPADATRAFIAFFFLLLGLRLMVGSVGGDGNLFLGDFFASLALTFFWLLRRK